MREPRLPTLEALQAILGDGRERKTRCHACNSRRLRVRREPCAITWYCRACLLEGSVRTSRSAYLCRYENNMEAAFLAPFGRDAHAR